MRKLSGFYNICFLFTFLLLINVISGCSQDTSKNDKAINSVNKEMIVEIWSETSETVYPKGKILILRVYNDKEVEFDFYPPNTPDRLGATFSASRKKSILSQKVFDDVSSIIKKSDIRNAGKVYEPIQRPLDATIEQKVYFKTEGLEKTIMLKENDSHLHLEEKTDVYPASLVELLQLAKEINLKLRKEINIESR